MGIRQGSLSSYLFLHYYMLTFCTSIHLSMLRKEELWCYMPMNGAKINEHNFSPTTSSQFLEFLRVQGCVCSEIEWVFTLD